MSITIVTDVFCDGDGCLAWTDGVVGHSPDTKGARRKAADVGWTSRRIDGRTIGRTGTVILDLCPDCTTKGT